MMGIKDDAPAKSVTSLTNRYLFPPFSILSAREGDWQNRKRAYIGLGIQSELGRGGMIAEESSGALAESQGRLNSLIRAARSGTDYATERSKGLTGNMSDAENLMYALHKPSAPVLRKDDGPDNRVSLVDVPENLEITQTYPEVYVEVKFEGSAVEDPVQSEDPDDDDLAPYAPSSKTGGLTWGNAPEVTEKGLNYYRARNKIDGSNRLPAGRGGLAAKMGEGAGNAPGTAQTFGTGKPGTLRETYKKNLTFTGTQQAPEDQADSTKRILLTKKAPGLVGWHGGLGEIKEDEWLTEQSGTSIFDPVLTELQYAWFAPKNGWIIDPFCGGSVRGIVASLWNRKYFGMDLRKEQTDANDIQWRNMAPRFPNSPSPVWACGDSRNIRSVAAELKGKLPEEEKFGDFLFSCPPYADLEVYSDDPRDLSTLDYDQFRLEYARIIIESCALMKPNTFAVFVVGEVRCKRTGFYYGFVRDTIEAFEMAGFYFYNETILATMVGSLPLRCGKQFDCARKIGKTHQNILMFCNGDPRIATENCGEVDISIDPLGKVAWRE